MDVIARSRQEEAGSGCDKPTAQLHPPEPDARNSEVEHAEIEHPADRPHRTGKTLMAQDVRQRYGLAFAIVDATLSRSRYVGLGVENINPNLLQASDGDVQKSSRE